MKKDDLERELRNLKLTHLTESELAAYCDQELDQIGLARVEAHLKQCFICERQLALLVEENAALSARQVPAEDVAFVEQLMQRMESAPKPTSGAETANEVSLHERLTEYLREMAASWRIYFGLGAMRGEVDQGEEVWQWQSEDEKLWARATIEKNADLIIHFSSNRMELEGARLEIRLGAFSQEIILRRVSDAEVYANVAVPWRQRPRNMADISIELI